MDNARTLGLLLERVVDGAESRPDEATTTAILDQAARLAGACLAPIAPEADRQGCLMVDGRVRTPPGYREAWREYADGGWAGLTAPEASGGQGLPMALAAAVQELLDAADPAFGMLAISVRCATRLLARHGDPCLSAIWLPKLAAGAWGATICISEPQAGSDVGRIRTRAMQGANGAWRITGEKCWISCGDHDLTERIGHFVLARPRGAPDGTRGLSLFLVPDTRDNGTRNGVSVARAEEKLGLHASPTCALVFEDAAATPVGPEGRGLSTLFAMITAMRLGVASQGAAVANAAVAVAERYARDREQGALSDGSLARIIAHAEVRRLLLGMRLRAEAVRLMALQAAAWVDAADRGDAAARTRAGMLLPIAKTLGAEAAFANADAAIQVLGGAGYVRDWPVERMLRDSRVFAIYEGTTAIQGLDLLLRHVPAPGALRDLLAHLEPDPALTTTVEAAADFLSEVGVRQREAAAVPFLRLLGLACTDGLLRRAGRAAGPLADRYAALAAFYAVEAPPRAAALAARCRLGDLDAVFDRVFPN